jgi:hypothetical protein
VRGVRVLIKTLSSSSLKAPSDRLDNLCPGNSIISVRSSVNREDQEFLWWPRRQLRLLAYGSPVLAATPITFCLVASSVQLRGAIHDGLAELLRDFFRLDENMMWKRRAVRTRRHGGFRAQHSLEEYW